MVADERSSFLQCKKSILALLDALAAHQFGRDASHNGHLSYVGDQSKMTDGVEKGLAIFGEQ
jgi:hypothetical protein